MMTYVSTIMGLDKACDFARYLQARGHRVISIHSYTTTFYQVTAMQPQGDIVTYTKDTRVYG